MNVEPELPVGLISLISNVPKSLRNDLRIIIKDLNLINYTNNINGTKTDFDSLIKRELEECKADVVGITMSSGT